MPIETIDDKIEEIFYIKLSKERNNVARNYLSEIISLESEYFYLYAKFSEMEKKYLEDKADGINREKDIADDYWIFNQNLVYRYYSLLQKFSQLINALWVKELKEKDCSFDKIRKICKEDPKFEPINQKLKKINIESVEKILEKRKIIVHRRGATEPGSLFILLEEEDMKEFSKWEEESRRVLETAYEKTFQVIEDILTSYIKEKSLVLG